MAKLLKLGDPDRQEERALKLLAKTLPDEYTLAAGIEDVIGRELDCILFTNRGVFVIELKNYHGKVVARPQGKWVNGPGREPEMKQANKHWKMLAQWYSKRCPESVRFFYGSFVIVTGNGCSLDKSMVNAETARRIGTLSDAPALIKAAVHSVNKEKYANIRASDVHALTALLENRELTIHLPPLEEPRAQLVDAAQKVDHGQNAVAVDVDTQYDDRTYATINITGSALDAERTGPSWIACQTVACVPRPDGQYDVTTTSHEVPGVSEFGIEIRANCEIDCVHPEVLKLAAYIGYDCHGMPLCQSLDSRYTATDGTAASLCVEIECGPDVSNSWDIVLFIPYSAFLPDNAAGNDFFYFIVAWDQNGDEAGRSDNQLINVG